MPTTHPALAATAVVAFALLAMWRVRVDYATRGRLTRVSATLQLLMFFLHGMASYSFIDSRLSRVDTTSPLFPLALSVMLIGLAAALITMGGMGWSGIIGRSVTGLRQGGLYTFTRNPQLIAYLVFLTGYALLWPSWLGATWLGLYCLIAHLMVLNEETHLHRAFGHSYDEYTSRTPRYLGLPRAPSRR